MAEPQSKGDILALEEELEQERADASRTFEDVQRRLKRAGSDPRLREETGRRLAQQSEQIQQELEALEAQMESVDKRVRQNIEREIVERIEEIRSGAEPKSGEEIEVARRTPAQRRLDGLVGEIEEAGRHVQEAESRLAAEIERLQRKAEARVKETAERVERETEGRLRGEIEELRAALDRERSSRAEKVEKASERAKAAEQRAAEAEEARLDREVDARSSAAAWLRGQVGAIEAKAERAAREQVSAARREAVEKVSREAEDRIARAERRFAERERELAGDLEGEVARYRELRDRIGSAEPGRTEAAGAEAPPEEAPPQTEEPETDEPETEEQPAVEVKRSEGREEKRAKRRAEKERRKAERGRVKAERKRAAEERRAQRARAAQTKREEAEAKRQSARQAEPEGPKLDVNEATFEQLRQLGLSVTQATRVIAYRQRQEGFESVDDLDTVPGFPRAFLDELKRRLSA